MPLYIIPGMRP